MAPAAIKNKSKKSPKFGLACSEVDQMYRHVLHVCLPTKQFLLLKVLQEERNRLSAGQFAFSFEF